MNSLQIRDLAHNALLDLKGIDVVSLEVSSLTTIADYMLICTGRSSRHIHSLAENVAIEAKKQRLTRVQVEGTGADEWILVDLGDVIVHVMTANTRTFYSLEDLWEPIKELREIKK